MTALNKRVKKVILKKEKPAGSIDIYPLLAGFSLAFVAAGAQWADCSLYALALVLAAAEKDSLKKPAMATGAMVRYVIMGTAGRQTLPYLIAVAVYISVFNAVKREKTALLAGLTLLFAGKVIAAGGMGGLPVAVYTLLEAWAVWGLVSVMENCTALYNPEGRLSAVDYFTLQTGAAVVVFSLSGADSYLVYPGRRLALGAAWLYLKRGAVTYSLMALVCGMLYLADKSRFAQLFLSFGAVWAAGAVAGEKSNLRLYGAAGAASLVANLVFLPRLGGFQVIGTVIFSLVFYILIPCASDFGKVKKPELFTAEKDYRQLIASVKKLEESLNFLGSCAIDISRLNEKNLSSPSLEEAVAEEVCRDCRHFPHCWQEKYSYTAAQFARYAKGFSWRSETGFEMGFYSQCVQIEKLKKSFEENSRLLLSKKYILQSRKNNQKLLQASFMSIAARVGELIHRNQTSCMVNSSVTMRLDSFLSSLDIMPSYCLCTRNPDRAAIAVLQQITEKQVYKILQKLESLYGRKFSVLPREKQGTEYIYSFFATPAYGFSHREKNLPYRDINGDCSLIVPVEDRLYVLLSDGMGTGAAAAAESKTVTAMARSLLTAGVGPGNTLDIVNLAMNLRGSGEGGATLDILTVSLADGAAALYKAGGASTIVINEKEINRYAEDSLPLGVVKDVKYSVQEFTLGHGDTVIMMTDGVGGISRNVQNLYSQSCREIASYILNENKTMDDKTALVIRLEKAV